MANADFEIYPLVRGRTQTPAHYGLASRVGNLVFVAGLCSRDPEQDYKTVGTTLGEQMEVIFTRIRAALAQAGTSLEYAVDVTIFLRDIRLWGELRERLPGYFATPPPPTTIVEAKLVRENELCEIKVTAVIPDRR
jgi:enamine deaminase RidA (YjgF/YER057c/UK114 family)